MCVCHTFTHTHTHTHTDAHTHTHTRSHNVLQDCMLGCKFAAQADTMSKPAEQKQVKDLYTDLSGDSQTILDCECIAAVGHTCLPIGTTSDGAGWWLVGGWLVAVVRRTANPTH